MHFQTSESKDTSVACSPCWTAAGGGDGAAAGGGGCRGRRGRRSGAAAGSGDGALAGSGAGWRTGGSGAGKAVPGEEHRRLEQAGAPAEGEGRPRLRRSTDAQTGPLRRGRGGMTTPCWRSGAGGGEG